MKKINGLNDESLLLALQAVYTNCMTVNNTAMQEYQALKKVLGEMSNGTLHDIEKIQKILNEKLMIATNANKVIANMLPVQERSMRATVSEDSVKDIDLDTSFLSDDIKKLIQSQVK